MNAALSGRRTTRHSSDSSDTAVVAPGIISQDRATAVRIPNTELHDQGVDSEAVFDTSNSRRVTRSNTVRSRSQENYNGSQPDNQNRLQPGAEEHQSQRASGGEEDDGRGGGAAAGGAGGDEGRGEEEEKDDVSANHVPPPTPPAGSPQQGEQNFFSA